MIYRVPEKEEDWMAISHPALAKNNRSCAKHFCICRTPPEHHHRRNQDVSFRGYPQMARISTTKVASVHLVKRVRVVRIYKF
jgi:hypothetical protein